MRSLTCPNYLCHHVRDLPAIDTYTQQRRRRETGSSPEHLYSDIPKGRLSIMRAKKFC